jgi:hypothetical protein
LQVGSVEGQDQVAPVLHDVVDDSRRASASAAAERLLGQDDGA